MNHKLLQELKELSPELAELKKHHKQIDMPIGYEKELFLKIKSDLSKPTQSKAKVLNLSILGAVAASCLILIAYLSLLAPSSQTMVQKDVYESYVLDNLDEYEDILVNDQAVDSWLNSKLDAIPETEIISYLENNLDHLELDIQY